MSTTALKAKLDTKAQALSEQVEETEPTTALAPADSNYLALSGNAIDIIRANLKSQPLTMQFFDVVKSPSGGSTVFSVPGLAGDEAEKELTGIILDYTTPRAYWDTPDPVEGTPPVCYSPDSLLSSDGKACAHCPYNTFGSKDGESNAKACKESVALFLLRPDNIMPIIVRVPVTSKLIFQRYMARLIGKMMPLSGVVTRITLEKATSKGGKPYALFHFEAVSTLTPEETAKAREYANQFMDIVATAELEPELSAAS